MRYLSKYRIDPYGRQELRDFDRHVEHAKRSVSDLSELLEPMVSEPKEQYDGDTYVELDVHIYKHEAFRNKLKEIKSKLSKEDFELVYSLLMED